MVELSLIPQPVSFTVGDGAFWLNEQTGIVADSAAFGVAGYLADLLRPATGFALPLAPASLATEAAHANVIVLTTQDANPALGQEGYTLQVTSPAITLRAAGLQGLFYAVQTLRQLLPVEIESDRLVTGVGWRATAVAIIDQPRFRWRGLHLDVGRHMFPVTFVKKFIDLMALYKYNIFHWHLTEDQGWRIEIKQYPRLTEVGSRRAATPYPADRTRLDGQPYGGYYTQAEIKEVVAYAQERFITVVPEIEMPGHSVAALAAYPELGCTGHGYQVRNFWGIEKDVFCAGNEAVYTFLENVLTEVMALFPSELIHIGGDECPKDRWEICPQCQAKIEEAELADEHGLQSYFVRRIETFLNNNGRRLIGWDEILEGGLAPNATVMSWRGSRGGIAAVAAGHDVVMSPNTHCYFDYYQSEERASEPPAIGGFLPLARVYEFDPTAGIPADKVGYVLGGQGNIWTEYLQTPQQVEYMTYPRATALAEVLWSVADPTAVPNRNYDDFLARLRHHLARLDQLGVAYRPLD